MLAWKPKKTAARMSGRVETPCSVWRRASHPRCLVPGRMVCGCAMAHIQAHASIRHMPPQRTADRAAERAAVARAGVRSGVNMCRSGREGDVVLFSLAGHGPESRLTCRPERSRDDNCVRLRWPARRGRDRASGTCLPSCPARGRGRCAGAASSPRQRGQCRP